MIKYVEKGPGLHERIRAAGLVLREENGEFQASEPLAVQMIIDSYTTAHAADYVCNLIDAKAKRLRDKSIRTVSPAEMAVWNAKHAEAMEIKAGKNPKTSGILGQEAAARNTSVTRLAEKVIANFEMSAALEAAISGAAGRHKDAVRALTDFAEIQAYDWLAGWPEV